MLIISETTSGIGKQHQDKHAKRFVRGFNAVEEENTSVWQDDCSVDRVLFLEYTSQDNELEVSCHTWGEIEPSGHLWRSGFENVHCETDI